ncbi:MAG: hypothetical protein J3Q66DRAFT_331492 [Benniella sp.]|nr:MAG: hypothetical protein J3Q66DRAFT_331492 [Benniella sp.]
MLVGLVPPTFLLPLPSCFFPLAPFLSLLFLCALCVFTSISSWNVVSSCEGSSGRQVCVLSFIRSHGDGSKRVGAR